MPTFEELLERWEGETAVVHRDKETGAWIFICIHSTRRGPAGGGTRLKVYDTPADGLQDAMRLSGAMTAKLAVANLPLGGGKAVIAVPELPTGEVRRGLFLRYGALVDSLGGTYRTSSDMNTGPEDMDVIAERTRWVFGASEKKGGSGNPARPTARGVYHGIRASLQHALGSADLSGRTVVIQGAGNVGSLLAELLKQDGAAVVVGDVDGTRARELASRLDGTAVEADELYDVECDVFSPCAVGGTLSARTIPRLRCRIVAGSANNQLAEPQAAALLHERGILYAPDFVINGGGAIALVALEQLRMNDSEVESALAAIGQTLTEIYNRAAAENINTARAADAIVAARLAE